MLRITIHHPSGKTEKTFKTLPIVVGKGEECDVDLTFGAPSIEEKHITIVQEANALWCINTTHDPFVTCNGFPFGKIELHGGEKIHIEEVTLVLSIDKETATYEEVSRVIAKKLHETKKPSSSSDNDFFFPFEEEWNTDAIDTLTDEELQSLLEKAHLSSHSLTDSASHPSVSSHTSPPHEEKKKKFSWHWLLLSLLGILILFLSLATITYVRLSEKEERQEIRAAQGIADMAMALTHAKIHHAQPNNRNWATADFIKEHVHAVLPSACTPSFSIDSHGQFHVDSYHIRIYTDKHCQQFVLIAQPRPNILQRLIPYPTLAIDSQSMELRRGVDYRSLQHLLSQPDGLDGSIAQETAALLKQGELIRLSKLSVEIHCPEFAPPPSLAWLHPGAENFIYNAPRYYLFTNPLVQKLFLNTTGRDREKMFPLYREELQKFHTLPHLVAYVPGGKRAGEHMQKIVDSLEEKDIYIGYIHLNGEGKITHSHMIKDPERKESSLYPQGDEEDFLSEHDDISHDTPFAQDHKERKKKDPLFMELSTLLIHRRRALESITEEMIDLLQREQYIPHTSFSPLYQAASQHFLDILHAQNEKIAQNLLLLTGKYAHLPFQFFLSTLESLGLENYLPLTVSEKPIEKMEEIETGIASIEEATDWKELEQSLVACKEHLNCVSFIDPQQLIYYQNRVRNQVIARLQDFLFSPYFHFSPSAWQEANRQQLDSILENAWIVDTHEQTFFLHAFDVILEENSKKL